MRLRTGLILLSITALWLHPIRGQDEEEAAKKNKAEYPSPDGRFAFRYSGDPDQAGRDEDSKQTYDLIERKSGKVLTTVVESENEIGPSARFSMKVLWKPDSKAFAITAYLFKRGSTLYVYRREGSIFKNVEIPELLAEAPEKEKKGKSFPHVAELNSESAKRWQKDGSLVVEVESIDDGAGYTITTNRKVVLSFDQSDKAKILKSTIKYSIEKQ